MTDYSTRLAALTAERGALCVGLDPSPSTLVAWGLDDDAAGAEKLARDVIAAVGDLVAVFKPQSGFFEAYGPDGVAALARVLADIRDAGALSILDIKRGDIGSTMVGYARAYLRDDQPLSADAITLSPFLGFGSLEPAFEMAEQTGRGCYVLCRTSNPEGADVQLSSSGPITVAQRIVNAATARNRESSFPLVGLVIGATLSRMDVDLSGFDGSILAPGIGAQGAKIEDLGRLFGGASQQVLPTASRSVVHVGPKVEDLRQAVRNHYETSHITR